MFRSARTGDGEDKTIYLIQTSEGIVNYDALPRRNRIHMTLVEIDGDLSVPPASIRVRYDVDWMLSLR